MSKLGRLYFAFPFGWPLFVNVLPEKQRYIKNMSLATRKHNCPCFKSVQVVSIGNSTVSRGIWNKYRK